MGVVEVIGLNVYSETFSTIQNRTPETCSIQFSGCIGDETCMNVGFVKKENTDPMSVAQPHRLGAAPEDR